MIKANELEQNTQTYVDFMSLFTGRDKETLRKDIGRNRWGRWGRLRADGQFANQTIVGASLAVSAVVVSC